MTDQDAPDVDARGLRCPIPVIRLASACKSLPPGTRVAVLTTDPAARIDVPAWARMRGHELIGQEEFVDHLRTTVRLIGAPPTCHTELSP